MSEILAFTILSIILAFGDIISAKTKAFVPSIFVAAVLFLIGFSFGMPKNILELAGAGRAMVYLCIYMLITHMGSLMSVKELLNQWKTILIAISGIVGISALLLTVGRLILGYETVIIATPPLTGGLIAALMMQEAALAKGLDTLAILSIVVFIFQGFVGYPITSYLLKAEGTRLLKEFKNNKGIKETVATITDEPSKFRFIPPLPEKYQTSPVILAKTAIVSIIGIYFTNLTGEIVSRYVILLIFGIIFAEIGFLERKPLEKANSLGFILFIIVSNILMTLKDATPSMILSTVGPLMIVMIVGVLGMAIVSIAVGKLLKVSKPLSFAIALTALYGFPANYLLVMESTSSLSDNEEEIQFLRNNILPPMLTGGFTTVTVASVLIGGIFVKLI